MESLLTGFLNNAPFDFTLIVSGMTLIVWLFYKLFAGKASVEDLKNYWDKEEMQLKMNEFKENIKKDCEKDFASKEVVKNLSEGFVKLEKKFDDVSDQINEVAKNVAVIATKVDVFLSK